MSWQLCFFTSLFLLAVSAALAVAANTGSDRRRSPSPFRLLFGGVFVSTFVCLLPIYGSGLNADAFSGLKTAAYSLHDTIQIFMLNTDRSVIGECANCPDAWLSGVYAAYLSVIFVAAPLLTFGFLISFFKSVTASCRYLLCWSRPVYVFSALNEKSVALGADLRRGHKRAAIVYTGAFREDSEGLADRARELRAICFRKDICSVDLRRYHGKAQITFFAIGEDETENVEQALRLLERYRDRENVELYVFSTRIDGELLLARADRGRVKLRRVNEVRSLVSRLLYERGPELFADAVPAPEGKKISAVLVGLGGHGTEMLKALAWYCQMDGYRVSIDAFDLDKKAEARFAALAPELMSEKYNGVSVPGEAEYSIRIHSGCDVTTQPFFDEIEKIPDATFVFISLGSDERNVRAAIDLRMTFERMKIKPAIWAVVSGAARRKALTGITNFRGDPYDIDLVGDVESSCSEKVVMGSELETDALSRHLKWGNEDEFWRYEYNYNSSVASAIHMKARIACGVPGAAKRGEDLTEEERDAIEKLEHRRWNAYMRSEGYVYSGSPDKSTRSDIGKMHPDLVDFSSLDEAEKRKDSSVGTK